MKYVIHATGKQPINKIFVQMERHLYEQDIISCSQRDLVVFAENGYTQVYWCDKDIEKLHKESEQLLDPKKASQLLKECRHIDKVYWKTAKSVLEKLKNPIKRYELAQLYDKYIYTFRKVLIYFVVIADKMTYASEQELKRIVEEHFKENSKETYLTLVTPTKPDLLFEELLDWGELLKNPSRERIVKHTKKYSILLPNIFSEQEAIRWAEKRISEKNIQQIQQMIDQSNKKRKKAKEKQKEIFNNLNSKKAEQISFFIQELALLRLQLKACWNGECYHIQPLYEEIAKVAECNVKDLYMFYTWRDIHALLHNGINLSPMILKSRKRYYLAYHADWKTVIYCGNRAQKKHKEVISSSLPDKKTTSFSGTVTNRGKVRGKVKVIKSGDPNEFLKIAGTLTGKEILVTGMTNPAMVVLIEKVGGIITDEGGIACHAAIISREFNIPCIVGTKIATQILKTGQEVELDAIEGIVRVHST